MVTKEQIEKIVRLTVEQVSGGSAEKNGRRTASERQQPLRKSWCACPWRRVKA